MSLLIHGVSYIGVFPIICPLVRSRRAIDFEHYGAFIQDRSTFKSIIDVANAKDESSLFALSE